MLFEFYSKKSWGTTWPSVGAACTTLVLTQKIPSLFAVFVSPTLAFGTPKARGMGERVWSEEISQMLVCMNPFPFTAFLLNLASLASVFFFFLALSLHKRQMTSPNLISLAACKGLPRRLPVNRVWVDTVQIQATLEPSRPVSYPPDFWLWEYFPWKIQ